MGQRYPLPVNAAMLTPANPRAGYPRYDTPADWSMGVPGNEEDIATRSEPVVDTGSKPSATARCHTWNGACPPAAGSSNTSWIASTPPGCCVTGRVRLIGSSR